MRWAYLPERAADSPDPGRDRPASGLKDIEDLIQSHLAEEDLARRACMSGSVLSLQSDHGRDP